MEEGERERTPPQPQLLLQQPSCRLFVLRRLRSSRVIRFTVCFFTCQYARCFKEPGARRWFIELIRKRVTGLL